MIGGKKIIHRAIALAATGLASKASCATTPLTTNKLQATRAALRSAPFIVVCDTHQLLQCSG